MISRRVFITLLVLLWLPVSVFASGIAKIIIQDKEILAEVAQTPEERTMGLMYRNRLGYNRGMLFVFNSPGLYGFHMKNTTIPLSIAFISPGGVIIEIKDMDPLSEEVHTPQEEYLYALEVNKGWFEENGIKPLDKIVIEYLDR